MINTITAGIVFFKENTQIINLFCLKKIMIIEQREFRKIIQQFAHRVERLNSLQKSILDMEILMSCLTFIKKINFLFYDDFLKILS